MEYPFNFVAKTTAKASEVMANFNAVRTILEGGLGLANFAEGGYPSGSSFVSAEAKAVAAPVDLLPSGAGGEAFNLATKSKVLFLIQADTQILVVTVGEANKAYIRSALFVDNVEQACYAELGGDSLDTELGVFPLIQASVGDHHWITLAAGAHQLRLIASAVKGSGKVWNAKVSILAIPTT